MASIQGIYIALFGRPADPLGLQYFNEVTGEGADLAAIGDLAATAEYQDRFEGMSNVQIINSIYQSLFGRDADLAGLTFFAQALQDGTFNINNIAIAILDGAQGDDLATVNNKIEAANQFTTSLDTGTEVAAYAGADAAVAGRAFLSGITADEGTIPTQAQTDAAIAAVVSGTGTGGEGQIITLLAPTAGDPNAGIDNVTATSGDDTIRALATDALESADVIDGGAGYDVLNISAGGYSANAAPVISNVERINNGTTVALDLEQVTGVQQLWSNGAGATYNNASLSTIFGSTAGGTIDINVAASTAGASDTLQIAVDDNNGTDAVYTSTDDADSIESISVLALGAAGTTGANATADDVDLTAFTDVQTVTISGAGNIAVDVSNSTELTSVDASGATGSVNVDASGSNEDVTVTTGSGNDVVTTGAGDDTLNGGSGNDNLTAGAGDDVLNGGTGNDTMNGDAGEDTLTLNGGDTATGGADADVFNVSGGVALGAGNAITDFVLADDDTIDFGGVAGSATNYLESTTAAASFTEAREIAATEFANDSAFQYVAVDVGADVVLFYNGGSGSAAVSAVTLTGVQFATIDQDAIV